MILPLSLNVTDLLGEVGPGNMAAVERCPLWLMLVEVRLSKTLFNEGKTIITDNTPS